MLTKNDVIFNPPDEWLNRIRRDHSVWLVKENRVAIISWPYEPPEPSGWCGRIGLRDQLGAWYIRIDGKGMDGSQLMLPMMGNLPENPPELPSTEYRQICRKLDAMERRLDRIEKTLSVLQVMEI